MRRSAAPVQPWVKWMRILVACECSGRVRAACRALGHDAWSCDLKPAEDGSPFHLQADVRTVLLDSRQWDALVAFPDCTYLCASGLHWNTRRPERVTMSAAAVDFVRQLLRAPVPRIALENPRGRIGTAIRPADQIIQPYDFGEDACKATCLWLKGLPLLRPTRRIPGRLVRVQGRLIERWANQTDAGHNRLAPSPTRSADRARTYPGIAAAMAAQWFGQGTALDLQQPLFRDTDSHTLEYQHGA